jgi:hypothetical protein
MSRGRHVVTDSSRQIIHTQTRQTHSIPPKSVSVKIPIRWTKNSPLVLHSHDIIGISLLLTLLPTFDD